ncbi:hypothetical protein PR048_029021 [Dryococelus australis]|uniref:Ribosomal protein S3 n=1 Tax=Dryococelus australis TaxID=614101 RepID=A0ABQ9GC73_9NEOP|nr:hypothetical protein PR048_029021 [Dryococelus australis]
MSRPISLAAHNQSRRRCSALNGSRLRWDTAIAIARYGKRMSSFFIADGENYRAQQHTPQLAKVGVCRDMPARAVLGVFPPLRSGEWARPCLTRRPFIFFCGNLFFYLCYTGRNRRMCSRLPWSSHALGAQRPRPDFKPAHGTGPRPIHLGRKEQRYDDNTARLARRSDEALGVRVTVARIAPSLLDRGRAVSIEQRRNERAEGIEDTRQNPPTSGVVLHDSHMQDDPRQESNQVRVGGRRERYCLYAHNCELGCSFPVVPPELWCLKRLPYKFIGRKIVAKTNALPHRSFVCIRFVYFVKQQSGETIFSHVRGHKNNVSNVRDVLKVPYTSSLKYVFFLQSRGPQVDGAWEVALNSLDKPCECSSLVENKLDSHHSRVQLGKSSSRPRYCYYIPLCPARLLFAGWRSGCRRRRIDNILPRGAHRDTAAGRLIKLHLISRKGFLGAWSPTKNNKRERERKRKREADRRSTFTVPTISANLDDGYNQPCYRPLSLAGEEEGVRRRIQRGIIPTDLPGIADFSSKFGTAKVR